jgi:hypothetical protein
VTGNERSWKETRERNYELYACETKQSHAELVQRAKRYGITDSQNNRFLVSLGLYGDSRTQGGGGTQCNCREGMTIKTTREYFEERMNKL